MPLFTDTFPGAALSAGWTALSNRPAGVGVADGTLNLAIAYPDDHRVLQAFDGTMEGGHVKFWAQMPEIGPNDWTYLYVRVHSEEPYRVATVEIYKGNPSFDPIGDGGYTVLLANQYLPGANVTQELAYDATRPFWKLNFSSTTGAVTFQNSADGVTYTDLATLTSGAEPWASTRFDLLFNGYAVISGFPSDELERVVRLDLVEVSYAAPPGAGEVTAARTAHWDVARSDIVGAHSGTRVRFAPAG